MQILLKVNYRYSFYLGYKLASTGAVCSFHHSFQLLLPFSSSLRLQLYFRNLTHLKSHAKILLHIQYFHLSFISQQEKAAAFIISAHVEHQVLVFVLIFSKSLITYPQYKYNLSVKILKIHMQNVKIAVPLPVSQNKFQCIFKSNHLTFL